MTLGRSRIALTASVVALGAVLACTALVAEDAVQCQSNIECTARGPDFVGTVCGPSGLCIPQGDVKGECTKNSDCTSRGPGQVCSSLQKKCLVVTSDDCTVAYGTPEEDGTVLFGLLSEVAQEDTLFFREKQHSMAAKLAFSDFFDAAGARFAGGRKAALIACSEHFPRRTSAHLANIGVHAVIGPSLEGHQRAVVETLLPSRVPSFTPWMNSNPAAVVPQSATFSWLTTFERQDLIEPLNALVAEQESRIRRTNGGKPIRVAVVVYHADYELFNVYAPFGVLMDQRLVFNQKSAAENQRDDGCGKCYQRFETGFANVSVTEQRAKDILAFAPDIIIPFADIDWGGQLLPKIEEVLQTASSTVVRPTYIQPFVRTEDVGYKLLRVGEADVRRRVTGIRPLRDNSFEVFQTKFREAYRPASAPGQLGPDPYPGAGQAYETALLVLFASYAARLENPEPLPEAIVTAMKRVVDTTAPTKVTLTDIPLGVQRLNAKENINLEGILSSLDYDDGSTRAKVRWTPWCLGDKGQYISGSRVFENGTFGTPVFCQ